MAALNIRDFPEGLSAQLKSEALLANMGYHDYCVAVLQRRRVDPEILRRAMELGVKLERYNELKREIAELDREIEGERGYGVSGAVPHGFHVEGGQLRIGELKGPVAEKKIAIIEKGAERDEESGTEGILEMEAAKGGERASGDTAFGVQPGGEGGGEGSERAIRAGDGKSNIEVGEDEKEREVNEDQDGTVGERRGGDYFAATEPTGGGGVGQYPASGDYQPGAGDLADSGKTVMDVSEDSGVSHERGAEGNGAGEVNWDDYKNTRGIGSVGAGRGIGGPLDLPRGGKAQDTILPEKLQDAAWKMAGGFNVGDISLAEAQTRAAQEASAGDRPHGGDHHVSAEGQTASPHPALEMLDVTLKVRSEGISKLIAEGAMIYPPGVVESLKERAKTDASIAKILHEAGIKLDREILIRWGLAPNYKPKNFDELYDKMDPERRARVEERVKKTLEEIDGQDSDDATREQAPGDGISIDRKDSGSLQSGEHVPESSEVGTGKPEVDMDELRAICAGNFVEPPKVPEEAFSALNELIAKQEKISGAVFAAPAKLCVSCETPLQFIDGKLACTDNSCGMYGRAQKGK